MYGGAWKAAVDGVTKESKSRTRQSDFTFTFHFHALEKEMATHASILAWRIPGTEESVGLPSMGSHRVGHDWHNLAAEAAPPFWTLFHLPPHQISLGCSRALALGALLCARPCTDHSVLHMVIYMFQCYSLKSSHPHLLPLSPKVCSLHLCLPLLPCM